MFTRKILAGEPIDVFNYGHHRRDFTYIDDIVEGVIRTLDHVAPRNPDWNGAEPDSATSAAPYRLYSIGNHKPVEVMRYIEVLEDCLGKKAEKNLLPLQPGGTSENPTRTSRPCARTWDMLLRPRWKMALPTSSTGIASSTGSDNHNVRNDYALKRSVIASGSAARQSACAGKACREGFGMNSAIALPRRALDRVWCSALCAQRRRNCLWLAQPVRTRSSRQWPDTAGTQP